MLASAAVTAQPQILVVHGPSGGSGKTLLSLLLAHMYASKGVATILVDLSQYGSVAPWLHIPRGCSSGVAGLLSAARESGPLDPRLRSAMVPAPGMGEVLHVVPSSGPAKMDQIKAAETEQLLRKLATMAQVIVVDTSSELTDRVVGALTTATRLVLTVVPDVVPGWQTLELVELLRSMYVQRERVGTVYSRCRPGGRFGVEEYQQALNLPVIGTVPEADDLRKAADQAGSITLHGNGPGIRAVRQVAHSLVPIFSKKELNRRWLWSR